MKRIDLFTGETGDVQYDIFTFPDGEKHIKFTEELDRKEKYTVACRIRNAEELFILVQVGDILNRMEVVWDLRILYLMSMRMDRVINFNEAFSLKTVANIINSLKPFTVGIATPHSDRTLKLIDSSFSFGDSEINNYLGDKSEKLIICAPDKGAYDRYWLYIEGRPNLTVRKKRDLSNGRILSLEVEEKNYTDEDIKDADILVLDDLCDGGGTFVLCAQKLRELFPDNRLILYVTHMVNPKGLENVLKVYDEVHITNTYENYKPEEYSAEKKLFVHNLALPCRTT